VGTFASGKVCVWISLASNRFRAIRKGRIRWYQPACGGRDIAAREDPILHPSLRSARRLP